jgi:hypothetical protein
MPYSSPDYAYLQSLIIETKSKFYEDPTDEKMLQKIKHYVQVSQFNPPKAHEIPTPEFLKPSKDLQDM